MLSTTSTSTLSFGKCKMVGNLAAPTPITPAFRPFRISNQPGNVIGRRTGTYVVIRCDASPSAGDNVPPRLNSEQPRPASTQSKPWSRFALQAALGCAALAAGFFRPPYSEASVAKEAPSEAAMGTLDPCSTSASESRRWRDTGIQLAKGDGNTTWMSAEELDAETRSSLSRYASERQQKQLKRATQPSKGGKLVKDPLQSRVPDPTTIPGNEDIKKMALQSAWRVDKLKDMTYTQFWNLIKERQVEKVRYTNDRRSVFVTTKATAPGGARVEKVGLPFDPDLFDHMVEHGVFIETPDPNPMMPVIHSIVRLVFPIWFSFLLIKFAFRVGRKKKRDKIFGGARMEMIKAKDALITFNDIAGIDQVKAEIMEIVQFLRDPQKFLNLGARSPAGVLLVGPPGTGKTLLAKAIAGEAGVPFFSIAGTEFMEMFVGVGASRVRDMFQKARKMAPCILFIDEFDGLGKARQYGGAGNDESVHTINQLLTEMDGFEDNTGVVVMAATNRPAALDQALTRPGRFDRIVHLPLPNMDGRIGILKVHARDKKVDPDLDYQKIARATAGFTGAELMNLMNQSAIIAARQDRECIGQAEVFGALEKIHRDKLSGGTQVNFENDVIPRPMRQTIALYEAARALIGYITPGYDEIQRISVCPGGVATGYTYFLPSEERLESRVVTRGYMESKMVIAMAGRCAEKLVLGDANVSTAGAADLELANSVAREMVFRCGFGKRTGPVALMDNEEVYLNKTKTRKVADMSTEMARIAYADVEELVESAEAKAYYGLAANYAALAALADQLMQTESMTGQELGELLEHKNVKKFEAPFVDGFSWGKNGQLIWPGATEGQTAAEASASNGNGSKAPAWWSKSSPYAVRTDIADMLGMDD